MAQGLGFIGLDRVQRLDSLFAERVSESPDRPAYRCFDAASNTWIERSWRETAVQVARWQAAMTNLGLAVGDRVAIMCSNSWEWVIFDQAALGLGLVVVPVYTNDRPDNLAWILENAGARLLVVEEQAHWESLQRCAALDQLTAVVSLTAVSGGGARQPVALDAWLPALGDPLQTRGGDPDELASIVYTSGTTGRPKGVMLSHRNILFNVDAALQLYPVGPDDVFLSFLPLSHTFERTVGYYLPMSAGAAIAYSRGVPQLAEDLQLLQPTLMIAVPRIFERIYGRIQAGLAEASPIKRALFNAAARAGWRRFEYDQGRRGWHPGLVWQPLLDRLVGAKVRARLGGRLRYTVSGGAALSPAIAQTFIGLGVVICQGYGLTETSPVISGNTLGDNRPETVGTPLPGVAVRVADDAELLTRSPCVMRGYWQDAPATAAVIDADGWLHTGDRAAIGPDGHITITGRLKEIVVLANGEKIPPGDMETAIALDPLFDQVMVTGEGRPYLGALLVAEMTAYRAWLKARGLNPDDPACDTDPAVQEALVARVAARLHDFPGYARVYRVAVIRDAWTVENGLLTPTLKLRRAKVLAAHQAEYEGLYAGHA